MESSVVPIRGKPVRILVITHSFPPELTPRAFRWNAIVRSLVGVGFAVDVVCARPPGTTTRESMQGMEIHRVRDPLSRSQLDGVPAGPMQRPGLWRQVLRWLYRQTWRRLYWPDYACAWYLPAVRQALKLLSEHSYDWMISVSHPFTGHLVGLTLKRSHPALAWLVDIGDPFCLMDDPAPNNTALYRWLSRRVDRAVLQRAEVVSVTTSGTRHAYAQLFPESAVKIQVIPPLLSLPVLEIPETDQSTAGPLRLVYVGTLYRRLRSPVTLLHLFERLVSARPDLALELHFIGNVNDSMEQFRQYQHWLGSRIFIHGMVSRERAQEAMRTAHLLVNLGNRSPTQLPSKVIEYVAMGKPILNLVTIRDDSSVGILASYPAALTLYMDGVTPSEVEIDEIVRFVADPPRVGAEAIRNWLRPYTEQSVSQDYIRLLRPATTSVLGTARDESL